MRPPKFLLLHGPNLNRLGQRDPQHYGVFSLPELEKKVAEEAERHGATIMAFQSNHEGALIDFLQEHTPMTQGIIMNPGALAHYSYALHDALLDTRQPVVEVHLSQISAREDWRQISVLTDACIRMIEGKGIEGYIEALHYLVNNWRNA